MYNQPLLFMFIYSGSSVQSQIHRLLDNKRMRCIMDNPEKLYGFTEKELPKPYVLLRLHCKF